MTTTFSQLVDDLAVELRRSDLRDTIATYVNQSVRELHSRPSQNVIVKFDANRVEDEQVVASANPYLWQIPSVTRFIDIETAYLPEYGIYVPPKNPKISREFSFQPNSEIYYYRTGPTYAFAGIGVGATVQLSYFMYPRFLAYKASVDRLVRYDPDTDSFVLIAGGGAPTEEQLDLEVHWPIMRWADTIRQGARSKVYGRLGDMDRSRTAYSAFESSRMTVWNSEPSSA